MDTRAQASWLDPSWGTTQEAKAEGPILQPCPDCIPAGSTSHLDLQKGAKQLKTNSTWLHLHQLHPEQRPKVPPAHVVLSCPLRVKTGWGAARSPSMVRHSMQPCPETGAPEGSSGWWPGLAGAIRGQRKWWGSQAPCPGIHFPAGHLTRASPRPHPPKSPAPCRQGTERQSLESVPILSQQCH